MAVSLIKKLSIRELTGRLSLQRSIPQGKPFSKIPGRMCYRLKSLVPSCILDEGYVFLGFSKLGQFVISYSLQIDADVHSAYPDHVYKLQWWLFIPCKRLQLISEVRLFGEENIFHSLFIAYCEWPEDRTKITIYGHSTPPAGEDGCQCYLTVTAVPSLGDCHECQMRHKVVPHVPSIQQCLRHSFCVHSKFELAPPFPFFSPKVQLRVDGIAVLNTGDSIVALQVDTQLPINSFDTEGRLAMDQEEMQSKAGIEKVILGSDLSIFGTVSTYFTEQEDPTQDLSPKPRNISDSPMLIEEEGENFYSAEHVSEHSDTDQSESKSTKSSSCDKSRAGCDKCLFGGSARHGSACGCSVLSNHRPALRTKNLSNSNNESPLPLKTGTSHFHGNHECLSPKSPRSPKSSGYPDSVSRVSLLFGQSSNINHNVSSSISVITCGQAGDKVTETQQPSENIMSPPPPVVQVQSPSIEVGSNKSQTDPEDLLSLPISSQRSFFSPSSSATSDCQSQSSESVIVHTTHTRTVTFSVRRFSTLDQQLESPTPTEDDYDLAYKSILPVQVVWNKKPLNIIRTVRNDMSLITVLQMTFDIEHYMVEAIRHDADWCQRYVAFCNYDLQILDVCPNSQSVYGTVYALIQAKESIDRSKYSRMMVKLYQTQFTFVFNLCTGLYSTLFIEPLTEVDERILRGRDWSSPGSKECCLLRRKAAVPQSFYTSVHVLSNEAVFREKSMSMLVAPCQYTAIIL
ncbi:DDB1- and CUL4-associated factor 15 [Biomphalaria glabrata]|uniref:DDB1- and CUL4-associated factor 15-like n=1 Tax=Biomphalaria glabrata TaxID=6526 RepID=A0A2C9KZM1_BIOGL|nr:DDB1- and CUL4-associated factor 15-like [Biomphalaria glabrata]KAI8749602.1 DDB1- and CUL4-associated factor 15-like [Biomphalaria glabrata]